MLNLCVLFNAFNNLSNNFIGIYRCYKVLTFRILTLNYFLQCAKIMNNRYY